MKVQPFEWGMSKQQSMYYPCCNGETVDEASARAWARDTVRGASPSGCTIRYKRKAMNGERRKGRRRAMGVGGCTH